MSAGLNVYQCATCGTVHRLKPEAPWPHCCQRMRLWTPQGYVQEAPTSTPDRGS